MKRCDGVYCLARLAAVVLVVTPVEAQSPFDHLPNPWGSFNDRFFERHHRFFPDSRFFRFGYRPGWNPEQYGYPYYYVIPNDDFYRGVEPKYEQRYPLDLAVMVQTELARLGFYDGPISGVIGPNSQMAIREFQEAQGLPVTGQMDENLVRALRPGEFDHTPPRIPLSHRFHQPQPHLRLPNKNLPRWRCGSKARKASKCLARLLAESST